MGTLSSHDTQTDLVINTLSRSVFDKLMLSDAILPDLLYLINDDYLDALSGVIENVATPSSDYLAANKTYVDTISAQLSTVYQLKDGGLTTSAQVSSIVSSMIQNTDEAFFNNLSAHNISVDNITIENCALDEAEIDQIDVDNLTVNGLKVITAGQLSGLSYNISNSSDLTRLINDIGRALGATIVS